MTNKIKILVMPSNKGGCAYYRCWLPFQKLEEYYSDKIEIRWNENPLNIDPKTGQLGKPSEDFEWCDIFFTQNIINFGGMYTLRAIIHAKQLGKFVHFDTDDLLIDLYDGHRLKTLYKEHQLDNITKDCYYNSDLVSVTQKKFAKRIEPFVRGILVVAKNAIDYSLPCWNAPKIPLNKKGPVRIGWVGGIHHLEDVKEISKVALQVNAKVGQENVEWGFYGRPYADPKVDKDWQQDTWDFYVKHLGTGIKNYKVYYALPTHEYGRMYSNIDVSIAPLQMNDFNDSKSDIKLMECGYYKVPLIASNVGCYDETIINGHNGYLIPPQDTKAWVSTLTKVIKNRKCITPMGENLYKDVKDRFNINVTVHDRYNLYEWALGERKKYLESISNEV